MPLDTDEKAIVVGGFGGFDDSVRTLGNHTETFAEVLDCLVMGRVDLETGGAKDPAQSGVGFKGDVVIDVAMVATDGRGYVLDERPTTGDVDPLATEADAEERLFGVLDPSVN